MASENETQDVTGIQTERQSSTPTNDKTSDVTSDHVLGINGLVIASPPPLSSLERVKQCENSMNMALGIEDSALSYVHDSERLQLLQSVCFGEVKGIRLLGENEGDEDDLDQDEEKTDDEGTDGIPELISDSDSNDSSDDNDVKDDVKDRTVASDSDDSCDSDYTPSDRDDCDSEEDVEDKPAISKGMYRFRCPTLDQFTGMQTPFTTLGKAAPYIDRDAASFINIMRQTRQLQFKVVSEKARDGTGWVVKLYVSWLQHKYALASHFHSTKKEAKSAVVTAFHKMARSVVRCRAFPKLDRWVAYYVYARVPDITSMFSDDLMI
jgi:hypothetical protein